jgi:hypothetical protein
MQVVGTILGQFAALLIAVSGLLVVLQFRNMALRVALTGVGIAALAAVSPTHASSATPLIAFLAAGAVGLRIAFLPRRRRSYGLAVYALVAGVAIAVLPLASDWLELHWQILLLAVGAIATTIALVTLAIPLLRSQLYRANPRSALVRASERILQRIFGPLSSRQARGPSVADFDLTRRSRRGPGPRSI